MQRPETRAGRISFPVPDRGLFEQRVEQANYRASELPPLDTTHHHLFFRLVSSSLSETAFFSLHLYELPIASFTHPPPSPCPISTLCQASTSANRPHRALHLARCLAPQARLATLVETSSVEEAQAFRSVHRTQAAQANPNHCLAQLRTTSLEEICLASHPRLQLDQVQIRRSALGRKTIRAVTQAPAQSLELPKLPLPPLALLQRPLLRHLNHHGPSETRQQLLPALRLSHRRSAQVRVEPATFLETSLVKIIPPRPLLSASNRQTTTLRLSLELLRNHQPRISLAPLNPINPVPVPHPVCSAQLQTSLKSPQNSQTQHQHLQQDRSFFPASAFPSPRPQHQIQQVDQALPTCSHHPPRNQQQVRSSTPPLPQHNHPPLNQAVLPYSRSPQLPHQRSQRRKQPSPFPQPRHSLSRHRTLLPAQSLASLCSAV